MKRISSAMSYERLMLRRLHDEIITVGTVEIHVGFSKHAHRR
jgi:hypothetical protein